MQAAGYDPRALVDYIARVQPAQSPDSFPDRSVRLENLEATIKDFSPSNNRGGDVFSAIQRQVSELVTEPPTPRKPPTLRRADKKL